MPNRRTDALTTVRRAEAGSRELTGTAVPYGVLSNPTLQLDGTVAREAFQPGAFTADVDRWMGRQDGARMAFRRQHGGPAIGVVVELRDEAAGVPFRARIFEGQDGDEYLRDVDAGLNGVSIEWGPGPKDTPSRRMRNGSMLHREAAMHAIAGSDHPAYDGARVALRDMEEAMTLDQRAAVEPDAPTHHPADAGRFEQGNGSAAADPARASRDGQPSQGAEAATQGGPMSLAERSAAERQTVAERVPTARVTRAEAIYGPRSGQSYFADMLHAREGDTSAVDRLNRHALLLADQVELRERALSMVASDGILSLRQQAAIMERAGDVLSSEIPGAYPNDYLPGLLTPRILKGRPMGGFFGRVPITDAKPKIFPKVTTSTTVAVQGAEGANPAASDFATTAVTATPLLYGGSTDVARQVLDGADPSVDAMLMQDLVEAYAQASETVIKTAVEAGSTASGVAITAATPYAGELANVINYQAVRFQPAEGVFIPAANYTTLLAQGDTTGRPFLPMIGAMNSDGSVGPGAATAGILGAAAFLSWASTANVNVFARPNDFVIYESSIAQFRYDQVVGPAAVRIGIWAYLVVGTRLGGLKVTAA